jgi:N-acetylmuramoyl-L-alanine amidase
VRPFATTAALIGALAVLPGSADAAAGKAFDFEVAPHGSSVETARPFNLVGMRWGGGAAKPEIRVSVRRPGRGWSRWQELHARGRASDPLWVGKASAVRYRLSRRVRGLRLHFVNVGRFPHRAAAHVAQAGEPAFVSRSEWGAGQCRPRTTPEYGSVKAVVVHHTVSLNDYTPAEAPAIVLAICRYHRNSNGWNDIGYNALVDKYGVLYEGRAGGLDQPIVGAQAQGFNAQTAGIASIADHTTVEATPATLSAMAAYIRWKLGVHLQPLTGRVTLTSAGGSESRYAAGVRVAVNRVLGHRDVGRTACPGELFYAQLDELRAMVASGASPIPAAHVSGTLADYTIDYGEIVPVSGLLTGPDGLALPGAPVEVQTNADGRWITSEALTTAGDGSFAGELHPRKRMYVRLRFPGVVGVPGATSARLLLRLRPVIDLRRPVSRARRGVRVRVGGTIGPRKPRVYVVLQQRIRGRFRTVGTRAVRTSRGRFSSSFVPAFRAPYRYAVVAKSDDDTDRGSTGWRTLRVR